MCGKSNKTNTFIPSSLFICIYIILACPILLQFIFSFVNWEIGNPKGFSLNGYLELVKPFRLNELGTILLRSFLISFFSSSIAFIASYILIKLNNKTFKFLFLLLITLPFLINESVRVFSWLLLLTENGLANQFIQKILNINLVLFNGTNLFNVFLVTFLGLIPFGVFINIIFLERIDKDIWIAAKDLGASEIITFYKIAIPLGMRGFLFSLIVTFFISLTLSSEVVFLGGDTKQSIRILINDLLSTNKVSAVFAIGVLLILSFLFLTLVSRLFLQTRK